MFEGMFLIAVGNAGLIFWCYLKVKHSSWQDYRDWPDNVE